MNSSEFGDWRIEFVKGPILTSAETDAFIAENDMPSLPEMLHGSSCARFIHRPTGKSIEFNARDALREWRRTCFERPAPQVVHSAAWRKERADALADIDKREYDWTFASDYAGTLGGGAILTETNVGIPYERLKVQEPIQFFDQTVLFQDELADNGDCIQSVKVRVMPSGFFCLHRLFTRIDDVECAIRDTRIYHAFGSPHLLHEFQMRANPIAEIRRKVVDVSKFADDAFMWEILTQRRLENKAILL